jgi:hypothetical protein
LNSVADKKPMQINQAVKNTMRLVKSTLNSAGVEIQLDWTRIKWGVKTCS